MGTTLEQARKILKEYGQEHVLRYYEELPEKDQVQLLEQIGVTDWSITKAYQHKEQSLQRGVITPLEVMTLPQIEDNRETYRQLGGEAIRQGKVAAVLLAGGMGTRLGSNGPKGIYNIGLTKELTIFECLIHNLMDVVRETGAWVHLFVMTSDKNHEMTVSFLKEKEYYGYDQEHIHFFKQMMSVATDFQGKVYMEGKGRISTSPNGNGGWYISLRECGLLELAHREGIEWFNVFAVDNVLQRIADPVFVGAVLAKECVVGAKVICKNDPDERIGVICLEDGRPSIVEYYELTDQLRDEKNEKGELVYQYGVILNYLFHEPELTKVVDESLPLHVVEKKITCLNEQGELVTPTEPNGYRYENLVLDMIHQLDNCLPFEVEREKEFAPIKNLTGVDSVESARELLELNEVTL
jgi:UDP-N-acetylglucosamine/UDP-N-acetylgalactosamine diphosphorylase